MKLSKEYAPGEPENMLYKLGWIFLVLGGVGWLFFKKVLMPLLPDMPCIFLQIAGIYCPGCGGTRAINALIKGQLLLSFWYHPLVLYTVFIFGGFMLTNTLQRLHVPGVKGWKFHPWYLYGALVVLGVNWVLKNVLLLGFGLVLSIHSINLYFV